MYMYVCLFHTPEKTVPGNGRILKRHILMNFITKTLFHKGAVVVAKEEAANCTLNIVSIRKQKVIFSL